MTNWSTQTWLITGTSTGLGRNLALAVLDRGGRLILTARNPKAVEDIAAGSDGRAIVAQLDVTNDDHIASALAAAEAFGGIDVLVNNAGYGFVGGIEEGSDQEVRVQFETNFFGAAALTRAVLPMMRARGSGYIVNISSLAGVCGYASTGWYSATKFALEGFSEALAQEGAEFGIKVLVVEPGQFRTDFSGRSIRRAAKVIKAYQSIAAMDARRAVSDGQQAGDPARAAVAIIQAMESEEPPFRLLLGKIASEVAQRTYEQRLKEVLTWRAVAEGAEFPPD